MNKWIPPFLLGFLALSFQIFLLREFSVHFYGNEITFGLLLATWLLWGGVGSIFASKLKFNLIRFPQAYYAIILLFHLCLICLRFSRFFLKILPGEITGTIPMLISSLVFSFFISFPLGILFVFNAHFLKGNLTQVYLLESIGASTAGLAVYFLLIPIFSNWQATSIVGVFISLIIFFSIGKRKQVLLLIFTIVFLATFFAFDFPTQKLYWKPFHLIQSKDTPYGKLQVLKTEEQVSLFNNSLLIYSYPDLASSEESVHFALLQNPSASNVLLVGGGAGGSLEQILKYPQTEVDYVELDPEIIRFSLQYLPKEGKKYFHNKRIHIFYQDGRAFLNKTKKIYDIIILNLPDPATAQINRFYTKEFFLKVKEKMTRQGIFSFRISSAENYISPELQSFLASLYYTLKEVFPVIEVVPGDTNIFLASSNLVPLNFEEISQKIERLSLENLYVSPELLFSRLNPRRIEFLKESITSGEKVLNLDLTPITYFYNSVLWSTQFKGLETKIFSFFSKIGSFWLLGFPLILFIALLSILGLKRKKSSFYLVPLTVMGLTTIVVEIIMIISFQTFFGYLYNRIALLFASFMIGLCLGSFYGKKRRKIEFRQILLIQFGFVLLLFLLNVALEAHPSEFLFFVFLLAMGFLGGDLFVVSNHLFLLERKNYGLGYGLDLLGSFLGALAASSFLIPIVGLSLLLRYIFLLNSFCFVFLLLGLKRKV